MQRPSHGSPPLDYKQLRQALERAENDAELFEAIVNAPFEYRVETALMFLGIIVLLQISESTGTIDRVALSNTELAQSTTKVSMVPFKDIKIDVNHSGNVIAEAIRSGTVQDTTDWKWLFEPVLTPQQARINQASAGIAYSAVYPLKSRAGGALIFSYYQYEQHIGSAQEEFMQIYTQLVDEALGQP